MTTAKVVEEISLHNTNAGWALMVANTSAWWGRTLPEKGIEEIYRDRPDALIAGAFHPPMRAVRVNGGCHVKRQKSSYK